MGKQTLRQNTILIYLYIALGNLLYIYNSSRRRETIEEEEEECRGKWRFLDGYEPKNEMP